MPDSSRTLLLVDDDATFRNRLASAFAERGFEVRTAADGEQALLLAHTESPELALLDLKMPGMSGLELVRALKQIDTTTNIVVLTGYGSIATALEAVRLGATHYLTKPADIDDILAAFERSSTSTVAPSTSEHEVPSLARAEWEHIQRVLLDSGGNISQAARLLGLHRRSLQRKLFKHPASK
ncbi:MAG: response regulator [Polyangiaceae bacterium]|nr:response regulator [Polyangiaceae bacterium]